MDAYPVVRRTPFFDIQQLAEGVFAAIATPSTGAWGNAGIVALGESALVFDTCFAPQAAQALRACAEDLTGTGVRYVVNSHRHLDHVLGNQIFADALIIATTRTHERMAAVTSGIVQSHFARLEDVERQVRDLERRLAGERDDLRCQELAAERGDLVALRDALPGVRLQLPHMTFDERLVLHDDRRTVEVLTHGGGHTESDAFLFLPAEGIAFVGDLVQPGHHVMLWHGDPQQWAMILERIAALDPRCIVGGHGPVGTGDHVAQLRRYIAVLEDLARDGVRQGRTAEEMRAIPIAAPYRLWRTPGDWPENLAFLHGSLSPTAVPQLSATSPSRCKRTTNLTVDEGAPTGQ